ncbi:MAG: hypothetical protein IMZ71_05710 [Chloroflexi bacterium]|nr:hypothetical protein [Chloroflexota bacterium]
MSTRKVESCATCAYREAVVAMRDRWRADPLVSKFYVRELSALIAAYPVKPTPAVKGKP